MSEQNEVMPLSLTVQDEMAKTNAIIAYGLMILGLFTGIFWIIGAIWAMIKKSDAQNSVFEDHYTNIIKTFWWGVALSVVGLLLAFFVVGYFILLATWIWSIFKIVKGLARITSNKAYN